MFGELHIGMVEWKGPKNIGKLASNSLICIYIYIPWEPTTFMFSGYNPYFGV